MEQQTHETKKGELDSDKLWAILAYFFFPLPLILKSNRSSFLNYHINQGIIFTIVWLIGSFVFGILHILGWLFNLVMMIILIIAIVNVSKKKKEPMPIIGELFDFIK